MLCRRMSQTTGAAAGQATGVAAAGPRKATAKRWNIAPASPDAEGLASHLRVSRIVAQILLNRGLSDPAACEAFLRPNLKLLHDPSTLPGVPRAAERIARAVRESQPIAIYGDYDVDGITATSILYHALRALGATVRTYIPHRVDEGYGLNAAALTQLIDEGAQLIITVDCGITAVGPAEVAAARGVDLIITDHHEWKESEGIPVLPKAYAVVHPRIVDSCLLIVDRDDEASARSPALSTINYQPSTTPYPNPHLCGAGVAFKLAWGVGQAIHGAKVGEAFRSLLVEMTALCALGTIADVVPLVGENRVIASFGLKCLPKSQLTGIIALIASANLDGEALDAYHVGFLLAPRLNAAGRMGHAALALEMLTTAPADRAIEIATYLEQQNRQRQAVEKQTLAEVLAEVARRGDDGEGCCGVLIAGKEWHPGVIGIVASRVVERLHRPTVLISMGEAHGAGSGRSIAGFHLAKALQGCTDLLVSHGGHEMAAGLKVTPENLEALRERFQTYAREHLSPEQLIPQLHLDAEVKLSQINEALVHDLERLGPFGHANRKPLLACCGVEIAATPRRVGKTGDHLQLQVRQNGTTIKGIAFNTGHLADQLTPGTKVDLAVEPGLNHWNGRTSVEVQVRDIRFGGAE